MSSLGYGHPALAHVQAIVRRCGRLAVHPRLVVFALLGVCSLQDSPGRWVAIHRMHHQHSDKRPDPHSPLVTFFWGHMGWLLKDNTQINSLNGTGGTPSSGGPIQTAGVNGDGVARRTLTVNSSGTAAIRRVASSPCRTLSRLHRAEANTPSDQNSRNRQSVVANVYGVPDDDVRLSYAFSIDEGIQFGMHLRAVVDEQRRAVRVMDLDPAEVGRLRAGSRVVAIHDGPLAFAAGQVERVLFSADDMQHLRFVGRRVGAAARAAQEHDRVVAPDGRAEKTVGVLGRGRHHDAEARVRGEEDHSRLRVVDRAAAPFHVV